MDGVQVDQIRTGRMTGDLTVTVQQGISCDEQAVYGCDEVWFSAIRDDNGDRLGVFVCFVPKNGYQRGKVHHVTMDRVLSVVDGLTPRQ